VDVEASFGGCRGRDFEGVQRLFGGNCSSRPVSPGRVEIRTYLNWDSVGFRHVVMGSTLISVRIVLFPLHRCDMM